MTWAPGTAYSSVFDATSVRLSPLAAPARACAVRALALCRGHPPAQAELEVRGSPDLPQAADQRAQAFVPAQLVPTRAARRDMGAPARTHHAAVRSLCNLS